VLRVCTCLTLLLLLAATPSLAVASRGHTDTGTDCVRDSPPRERRDVWCAVVSKVRFWKTSETVLPVAKFNTAQKRSKKSFSKSLSDSFLGSARLLPWGVCATCYARRCVCVCVRERGRDTPCTRSGEPHQRAHSLPTATNVLETCDRLFLCRVSVKEVVLRSLVSVPLSLSLLSAAERERGRRRGARLRAQGVNPRGYPGPNVLAPGHQRGDRSTQECCQNHDCGSAWLWQKRVNNANDYESAAATAVGRRLRRGGG
jgi:hypothetical protein